MVAKYKRIFPWLKTYFFGKYVSMPKYTVTSDKTIGKLLWQLGAEFSKRGDLLKAIDYLTLALDYDAENIWILKDRSMLYLYTSQIDLALNDIADGWEIDPNNVWLHAQKGACLIVSGMFDEADEVFEQAALIDPNSEESLKNYRCFWLEAVKEVDHDESEGLEFLKIFKSIFNVDSSAAITMPTNDSQIGTSSRSFSFKNNK